MEKALIASKKMGFLWLFLVLFAAGSDASGQLTILHSPDSLKFSGNRVILESLLKEVFSASLGLSVEENSQWDGLSISDPFDTPEAVVEVYVDGATELVNESKKKHFPLAVDEYEPDTFSSLKHRVSQRFSEGTNKLVAIDFSEPSDFSLYEDVFGTITPPKVRKQSLQHLKHNVDEDYDFLAELETLKAFTEKIASGVITPDNVVDVYFLRFRSLHALSDLHGPNSLQTKEAKKLLAKAVDELNNAFVKSYDGSVLVSLVTTDIAHKRRVRAADDKMKSAYQESESDKYSSDYSAIFNIILWFGVVFVFSLVAIVYALMDMDPGRDSIIYRMTSTRMKKEN